MLKYLLIASIVALAAAADDSTAEILVQEQDIMDDGSYAYRFETSNGIKASQSSADGINSQGGYTFIAPDGVTYDIQYVANEGGFQPQGAHLPVAPADLPAPNHVIETLMKIRANPPSDPEFNLVALDAEIARLQATQG
jgi:hypothetical protein